MIVIIFLCLPGYTQAENIQGGTWKVDAATSWNGTNAYFFKGNQYANYTVNGGKIANNYPLTISGNFASGWPANWTSVDAAVSLNADNAYFFKGTQYIRYETKTGKVAGPPKAISGNFSGNWPSSWTSVDAAVNLDNGNVYFFRGTQYIRYNIAQGKITGNPAPIEGNFAGGWPKWPSVDAAVNYGNGHVYFFRNDQYFRYTIKGATCSTPQTTVGNFVGSFSWEKSQKAPTPTQTQNQPDPGSGDGDGRSFLLEEAPANTITDVFRVDIDQVICYNTTDHGEDEIYFKLFSDGEHFFTTKPRSIDEEDSNNWERNWHKIRKPFANQAKDVLDDPILLRFSAHKEIIYQLWEEDDGLNPDDMIAEWIFPIGAKPGTYEETFNVEGHYKIVATLTYLVED